MQRERGNVRYHQGRILDKMYPPPPSMWRKKSWEKRGRNWIKKNVSNVFRNDPVSRYITRFYIDIVLWRPNLDGVADPNGD